MKNNDNIFQDKDKHNGNKNNNASIVTFLYNNFHKYSDVSPNKENNFVVESVSTYTRSVALIYIIILLFHHNNNNNHPSNNNTIDYIDIYNSFPSVIFLSYNLPLPDIDNLTDNNNNILDDFPLSSSNTFNTFLILVNNDVCNKM